MSKLLLTTTISILLTSSAWALNFDPKVPADVQKQMVADLDFMYTVQGEQTSALHKEIFGAVDGSDYKKFFESRIANVGFSNCGNANAVACVMPMFSKTDKMYITNNYIKFSHPQIARVMVVYHESRHTEDENSNWGHARCPVPFKNDKGEDMTSIWTGAKLAGEPACDVTPYGSYGSSMIMLKNVSKFCANCNEKVKMDAGIYADDQLQRVTDASAKKSILNDLYQ